MISKVDKKKLDVIGKYNYRIEFEYPRLKINYPFDFEKAEKYFPVLQELYKIFDKYSIQGWHHFEPYVELTFIYKGKVSMKKIWKELISTIEKYKCKALREFQPGNFFADWYYSSYEEAIFGIESMILTSKLAMTFWKYNKAIRKGKGKDRMLMRRFHVLANQLAYSYTDEARVLNLRSIFAGIAATGVDQDTAVKLYESITSVKY